MIFIARVHIAFLSRNGAVRRKNLARCRKTCCERFSRRSRQEIAISRLDSERIRAIITVKSGFVPFVPLHGAARARGYMLVIKIEHKIRFKIDLLVATTFLAKIVLLLN